MNFYYRDPVAITDRFTMDRFICQPKFAGKTYMEFRVAGIKAENQEGIKASYFRESDDPAHRHACCIYSMLTNRSQAASKHAMNFVSHAL